MRGLLAALVICSLSSGCIQITGKGKYGVAPGILYSGPSNARDPNPTAPLVQSTENPFIEEAPAPKTVEEEQSKANTRREREEVVVRTLAALAAWCAGGGPLSLDFFFTW